MSVDLGGTSCKIATAVLVALTMMGQGHCILDKVIVS